MSLWIKADRHLRRTFRGALKLARIENFHFHDLRYTFATPLVQQGSIFTKVQCHLGHKLSIMTQRYVHCEEVEILERYSPHRTWGHTFSTNDTSGRTGTEVRAALTGIALG